MPTLHLFATYCPASGASWERFGSSRRGTAVLVHLMVMTTEHTLSGIDEILTLTQLCEHLHISAQTIYDLRCQGRGPRGFRVGRELRFRTSEINAWLSQLETDDAHRHGVGGR